MRPWVQFWCSLFKKDDNLRRELEEKREECLKYFLKICSAMKESEISICFLIRGGYLVLVYKY